MIKLQFGSHVYGTNIETSDTDYKGIYLPPISSCILGNINHSITFNTKHDFNKKNNKSDIDFEIYSLQKYISLLIEGQTVAIDMLFTPKKFYVEFDKKSKLWEVWNEIINNKIKLLPSGISSFAGYCKTQAAKYGLKGSRIAAVKKTIHLSEQLHQEDKISVHSSGAVARPMTDGRCRRSRNGTNISPVIWSRTYLYCAVAPSLRSPWIGLRI